MDIAPDTPDAERVNFSDVVLIERLRSAIGHINSHIPHEAREEALKIVIREESQDLIHSNRSFHYMLVNGVDVEYRNKEGEVVYDKVQLFDFDDLNNNDFLAVNQFTVIENRNNRRPDIVLFINGMPLVVIELKRPEDDSDFADLTEGLKTIDMVQITKLGYDNPDLTAEKLINLYRFGQRRSPWEDLSDGKLMTVEDDLKKRVVGQDHAVDHVSTTIIKAAMGLSGIQHSAKMSKPKGVLFFVGPTGVGKTELAKATAEFLFGDETACVRFDMSEYSHEESDQRLIGAPPGYVGFEEGGQLINAVLEKPFSVLLFDEIEKAHPRILDKFLQIFEDGRLTDGKGVTAYFSESIIIFTSNIGASTVDSSKGYEEMTSDYMREVKNHFNNVLKRPELLNRIGDNIIVFNTIEDKNLRQEIIKRKLEPLQKIVSSKFNVKLLLDNEIYAYFEKRAEMSHGGRGLLNAAERDLINPLSRYLFRNKQFLIPGRSIHVSFDSNSETKIKFDITE
ncbi:AAA family ATPase [Methanolobus sp.]|uniref:AAA family ATPase n=1 Tax=Methanolobus sp. TaxID=1874737 RepID=UPI0025DFBDE0|nr:AAA family ATPase [Methanolobus sp.]